MESAMYAVLNLDRNTLEEVCRKASEKGPVYLANYNCPGRSSSAATGKGRKKPAVWRWKPEPAAACL